MRDKREVFTEEEAEKFIKFIEMEKGINLHDFQKRYLRFILTNDANSMYLVTPRGGKLSALRGLDFSKIAEDVRKETTCNHNNTTRDMCGNGYKVICKDCGKVLECRGC